MTSPLTFLTSFVSFIHSFSHSAFIFLLASYKEMACTVDGSFNFKFNLPISQVGLTKLINHLYSLEFFFKHTYVRVYVVHADVGDRAFSIHFAIISMNSNQQISIASVPCGRRVFKSQIMT